MNLNKFKIKFSKDTLVFLISTTLSFFFVFYMYNYITESYTYFMQKEEVVTVKAKITKVYDTFNEESFAGGTNYYTPFDAIILEGSMKGLPVYATQINDVFMAHEPIPIRLNDKVILFLSGFEDGKEQWILGDFLRTDGLMLLGFGFFGMLILFGGFKGVRTIISLSLTCMSVFMVLIPAILAGMNIYIWAIIISIFIIAMTIIIVNGISQKSFVAAVGCFSGSAVCGILTLIMDKALRLTGAVDEDSLYLILINPDNPIDLKAIIFAAILIGGVGAIMDVAISMSSSLYEVYTQNKDITPVALMKSGMTIGQDIMGTMANTLVLAYIGGSLSIVILLTAYNSSVIGLLNKEMIIVEILQALAGSIGILLTIPLTSFVSSLVYVKKIENCEKK